MEPPTLVEVEAEEAEDESDSARDSGDGDDSSGSVAAEDTGSGGDFEAEGEDAGGDSEAEEGSSREGSSDYDDCGEVVGGGSDSEWAGGDHGDSSVNEGDDRHQDDSGGSDAVDGGGRGHGAMVFAGLADTTTPWLSPRILAPAAGIGVRTSSLHTITAHARFGSTLFFIQSP